jgi:hypothetical protein
VEHAHAGGWAVAVGQRFGRSLADLGDAHHRLAGNGPTLRMRGPLRLRQHHAAAEVGVDERGFQFKASRRPMAPEISSGDAS